MTIFVGSDGDNHISGTNLADTIDGRGGKDWLQGNGGDDILAPGFGLYETVDGGSGTDMLHLGGLNPMTVDLEEGFAAGLNAFSTLKSIEDVYGSKHGDTIKGNDGANRFVGHNGDDVLEGRAGNDVLEGRNDDDVLRGGKGKDELVGGLGSDELTGGNGADRFVFDNVTDSIPVPGWRDLITDFRHGQADNIDLSAIDANEALAGNQKFKFVGQGTPTGAGEVGFRHVGSETWLEVSTDTDGYTEMVIELTGNLDLRASDFVL